MSRGMGRIERRLLTIFKEKAGQFSTFDLAAMVYDIEAGADQMRWLSDAQLSAVRRALIRLSENPSCGVNVCGMRGFHDRRQRWATAAEFVTLERSMGAENDMFPRAMSHGLDAFIDARRASATE
jgi:hypothetical protein